VVEPTRVKWINGVDALTTLAELVDPTQTAVDVIDAQKEIVARQAAHNVLSAYREANTCRRRTTSERCPEVSRSNSGRRAGLVPCSHTLGRPSMNRQREDTGESASESAASGRPVLLQDGVSDDRSSKLYDRPGVCVAAHVVEVAATPGGRRGLTLGVWRPQDRPRQAAGQRALPHAGRTYELPAATSSDGASLPARPETRHTVHGVHLALEVGLPEAAAHVAGPHLAEAKSVT
jgi:hypothetical protein